MLVNVERLSKELSVIYFWFNFIVVREFTLYDRFFSIFKTLNLWARIWSILENVLCAPERNAYSIFVGGVFCKYQLGQVNGYHCLNILCP